VLIFHSHDHPTIPFAMGRQLAAQFANRATFVAMDGAGHYPHRHDIAAKVLAWARAQHMAGMD
jgi:pimeloyl-ACP methyl ester carboxylesterase